MTHDNVLIANKKISIRLALVLLFVIQIFLIVSVIFWLTLVSGQKAIGDISSQLRNEVSSHIEDKLLTYIEKPGIIRKINTDSINLGNVDINSFESIKENFLEQMNTFKSIGYLAIGTEMGGFYGIERENDGELHFVLSDKSTGNNLIKYSLDKNGNLDKELSETKNYDPTTRPWYQKAVTENKPVWTGIYGSYAKPHRLAVTSVAPLYGKNNELKGVLGVDLVLEQFSSFLQELKIGQTGRSFIIDDEWKMVASSTEAELAKVVNEKVERFSAFEIEDNLIQNTASFIKERYVNLSRIKTSFQLDTVINNEKLLLQIVPLKKKLGLDWYIVLVVPEQDFMERINNNIRDNFLIILITLIITTSIGVYITQRITKPLLSLSNDMKQIADFKLDTSIHRTSLFQEIQVIQNSMEKMYFDLQERTNILNSLNNLAKKLVLIKDIPELGKKSLPYSMEYVKAKRGFILIYDQEKIQYSLLVQENFKELDMRNDLDSNQFEEAIKEKKTILINTKGNIYDIDYTSLLVSPIIINNEIKGMIVLVDKKEGNSLFEEKDIITLQTFTNLVTSVWENILLFELATVDSLSKLFVRRYFDLSFNEEVKRAIRYKNDLSLIIIDIDNFKRVNDTYGHLIGDDVIRVVADKVKLCVRETDFPARYGGEEIVVYLPQTPLDGAYKLAERIRKAVEETEIFVYNKAPLSVTISVGLSCLFNHGNSVEEIIQRADEALYVSKTSGKNKVSIAK